MKMETFLAILLAASNVFALEGVRVGTGWGFSTTADTTQRVINVEQTAKNDVVLNGAFATTNSWVTNASDNGTFFITGGAATFVATDATTNSIYQSFTNLTEGIKYRIRWTLAGLTTEEATNQVKVGLGSQVASDYITANGTYDTDLFFYTDDGSSNLTFTGNANAGTVTCTVDNVKMRLVPDDAYVGAVQLRVLPTDVPVYVAWNVSDSNFTNMYAVGRTIAVTSNGAVTVDFGTTGMKIKTIRYRTRSGSATLNVNGW